MTGNILIVDDEPGVRQSLKMILGGKYATYLYSEGPRALEAAGAENMDVALLDIRMPGMGGVELLRRLKAEDPHMQVAMITGYASLETAVESLRLGAFDYINKPFASTRVEELVRKGISLRKRSLEADRGLKKLETVERELNERMTKIYSKTVESLLTAINAKDAYTSNHSGEVARFSMQILHALKLPMSAAERETFRYVCSLHDIGKIAVSERILRKETFLTEAEMEEIKKHPRAGAEILSPIDFFKDYIPMVLHHHERFDGSGYPSGKKGREIPLPARILAVADTYHAMRSDRPYSRAMTREAALEEIRKSSGSHFDPVVVKAAIKVLD